MYQTAIGAIEDPVERYFAIARERQSIFLKKEAGLPRPWTNDAIYNNFKFCNVFREQDKTTRWFKDNVREPMRNEPEVLLATTVFRMFNRIEIGDTIFNKTINWQSAWDVFLKTGSAEYLAKSILMYHPNGPYVTGAYTLTSKPGMDKLTGICSILEDFYHNRNKNVAPWQDIADYRGGSLEEVWGWFKEHPYFGVFHSYEIVTDLRHTAILENAPDIMTWANVGPGCARGINQTFGRDINFRPKKNQILDEMKIILDYSRDTKYWPNSIEYPSWEMRDVEHESCEVNKYLRVYDSNGAKRPRGVYR